MTARQLHCYWTLWRAACATQGWRHDDTERRHQVMRDTLGYERSSRALDNREFDRVKARLVVLARPDDLDAHMAECDPTLEERKRLCHAIVRLARWDVCARRGRDAVSDAEVEAHVGHIVVDLYDRSRWRALALGQLCRLRDLLSDRLAATLELLKRGRLPADRWHLFAPSNHLTPTSEIIRRVTCRHNHLAVAHDHSA